MVCLGLEPGAAGWKSQMNPLSYGGIPKWHFFTLGILFLETTSNVLADTTRRWRSGPAFRRSRERGRWLLQGWSSFISCQSCFCMQKNLFSN